MDLKSEILREMPTGYWQLNERGGNKFSDLSGHGNHFTIIGTPSLGQVPINSDNTTSVKFRDDLTSSPGFSNFDHGLIGFYRLAFDGPVNYGSIAPFLGVGAYSIVMMISPIAVDSTFVRQLFRSGLQLTANFGVNISRSRIQYLHYNGNTNTFPSVSSPTGTLIRGVRCFIAVTRSSDGTVIRFYKDGKLLSENNIIPPVMGSNANQAGNVVLLGGGSIRNQNVQATISDVAAFNDRELSPLTVAHLARSAMRVYPTSLPAVFDQDNYNLKLTERVSYVQPVYGSPNSFPRTVSGYSRVNGTFELNDRQRRIFERFYEEVLAGGSLAFDSFLHDQDSLRSYRFMSPPKFVDVEAGSWKVTVDLAIAPTFFARKNWDSIESLDALLEVDALK